MNKLLLPLLLLPISAFAQPTTPIVPPGPSGPVAPVHPPPPMNPGSPFNPPVVGPNQQRNNEEFERDKQRALEREKAAWGEMCKTHQFSIANAFDQPDIISQLREAKTEEEKNEVKARAMKRMERQKTWYEGVCNSIKDK